LREGAGGGRSFGQGRNEEERELGRMVSSLAFHIHQRDSMSVHTRSP